MGASLGVLIGTVSAIVVLLVIRFAVMSPPSFQYLLSIVGQLLALAIFWGGGTWASGHMLQVPDQLTLETWYWIALLVSFLIPIGLMFFWLSLAVGIMTRAALEAEIRSR
jgi:hypothetical protein